MWAHALKTDGKIKRYKARFVVRGNCLEERVQFSDKWAPTSRSAILHCLFVMAAKFGWEAWSYDISGAYFNAKLKKHKCLHTGTTASLKITFTHVDDGACFGPPSLAQQAIATQEVLNLFPGRDQSRLESVLGMAVTSIPHTGAIAICQEKPALFWTKQSGCNDLGPCSPGSKRQCLLDYRFHQIHHLPV
jgi:hypothetical protein